MNTNTIIILIGLCGICTGLSIMQPATLSELIGAFLTVGGVVFIITGVYDAYISRKTRERYGK